MQCKYKFQDREKFNGKPYCKCFNEPCENLKFACDDNCQIFEDLKELESYKRAVNKVKSVIMPKLKNTCNKNLNIVCEDEKYLPTYVNQTDACMDLKIKIKDAGCYFLRPDECATFGTGIKVAIPENHVMIIFPRSSTGFKLKCMLANSTGIIDAGYRDEIKIALVNYGKETICLNDAQRIAQFIILPRPQLQLNLVEDDEDFRCGDRGGGIGSTGA